MPQHKGVPRPADVERMQRAVEMKKLAELELADAVVTAMRNGGSIRQVAAACGLSEATVMRWRQGKGLPTHEDVVVAPARERREQLDAAHPQRRPAPGDTSDHD